MKINNTPTVNQPVFKSRYTYDKRQTIDMYDEPLNYYSAATAYGKAMVSNPIEAYTFAEVMSKVEDIPSDETISPESAVRNLDKLDNITPAQKKNYIMACSFDTDKKELVINKKAMRVVELSQPLGLVSSEFLDVIILGMDEDTMSFNSFKMKSQLRPNGFPKRWIDKKPKHQSIIYRAAREFRRNELEKLVGVEQPVQEDVFYNCSATDLFTPLSEKRDLLMKGLNELKESGDVSDDLYKAMSGSLENNQFDLKKVYKEHYGLLNECKTLDEVKELYPEIEFPNRPAPRPTDTVKTLNRRLLSEDFDAVSIDILKKLYIGLEMKNKVDVKLENSPSTNMVCMKKAGFDYSAPSDEMKKFLDSSQEITKKYESLKDVDDAKLEDMVIKHAKRTSKVWSDYHDMTTGQWYPIRLMTGVHLKDDPKYKTSNLVNAYLFELYKKDANKEYDKNPLAKYDDVNYLSVPMKIVINKAYAFQAQKELPNELFSPEFKEFKSKFDTDAMAESFEHIKKRYKNSFFAKYWNEERRQNLQEGLQNSYDLLFEKFDMIKPRQYKQVTKEDVEKLIQEDLDEEIIPKVSDDDLSTFRFMTSGIQNNELKERCASCVANPDLVDMDYFHSVFGILKKSTDEDGKLDEDKARVLINLHDKFLEHIFNMSEDADEESFVASELEAYKDENGKIDYSKIGSQKVYDVENYPKYLMDTIKTEQIREKFVPEYLDKIDRWHHISPDEKNLTTFMNIFDINQKEDAGFVEAYIDNEYRDSSTVIRAKGKAGSQYENMELDAVMDKRAKKAILSYMKFPHNAELLQKYEDAMHYIVPQKNEAGIKRVDHDSRYNWEVKINGMPSRLLTGDLKGPLVFKDFEPNGLHGEKKF